MNPSILTEKQIRMLGFNDVIAKNKAKFIPGKKFTRKQFIKLFKLTSIVDGKTIPEMMRSNLDLVSFQTEINKLMRENGLYIASKNYYTEFHVAPINKTKDTVVRYSAEVDINRICTNRLEDRLTARVKNNTWGNYNKLPRPLVLALASRNGSLSTRHDHVVERMSDL